jgi:hypothetical protein
MRLNWGATMPFPKKFLHNKRETMDELQNYALTGVV